MSATRWRCNGFKTFDGKMLKELTTEVDKFLLIMSLEICKILKSNIIDQFWFLILMILVTNNHKF